MFFSKYKYVLLLASATVLWGTTFVVVQKAVEQMPVFFFIFSRFAVALFIIVPFAVKKWDEVKKTFLPGLWVGIALFAAYAFQTLGLTFTTAANSAFITGLNFVFTPLIGILFFHIKPNRQVLYAIIIALIGFFMLSYNPGMHFNPGDLITLLCAISIALQILLLDRYLKKENSEFGLLFHQVFWVTIFSLITSLFFEKINVSFYFQSSYSLFAILFTGIFCSAYGFYAQTTGQKYVPPVRAALIFILEPVFGSILDFSINGISSTWKLIGGILILAGLFIGEIKPRKNQL